MLDVTIADRVEPLAERLAEVLATPLADPLESEWIATPGLGMRTWLWRELALHLGHDGFADGIAANITPAFPGTLRTRVLEAVRGDEDPWSVETLAWAVLAVLRQPSPATAAALTARFGDIVPGYRHARRIADLFDRYHVHRPELIVGWMAGNHADALGKRLSAHNSWQSHLWLEVREAIGFPSPPESLPVALERLRDGDLAVDLPSRLVVFGLPTLPGGAGFIDLAQAVGVHRDLHVFLVEPSPAAAHRVWDDTVAAPSSGPRRRLEDSVGDRVAHPLLRSWGRPPRETTVLLADASTRGGPRPDIRRTSTEDPKTLLGRLQADIRSAEAPDGTWDWSPEDRSVQFRSAYGRARQVDIARDAILHALADDPTLSEDDILVASPDLTAFEPLIRAGFGRSSDRPDVDGSTTAPTIRYSIADPSSRRGNTVAAGLDALLHLVPGRFDAVEFQDFLTQPAVRCKFDFTEHELARVAEWVDAANVRWGLDAEHRAPFGLSPAIETNSWGAALDRILIGATLPDSDLDVAIGGVAPIGVEGDDVELAGRLAELLSVVRSLVDAASGERTVETWVALVKDAVSRLLDSDGDDRYGTEPILRTLGDISDEATAHAAGAIIGFDDMRSLLRERLGADRGRSPFFRGGVTVTSTDSLRSVPFRVIILLGMDQPAFNQKAHDGDDLIAGTPLIGDREPRADRRQQLLETLLAAGDRLILIRDGFDIQTNRPVPPAVVVAELHDLVRQTVTADSLEKHGLETHHPRQAYDIRSLTAGALGAAASWSFDPAVRDAAVARRSRGQESLEFLREPLSERPRDAFEVSELVRAVNEPLKYFVTNRLDVRLPDDADVQPTQIPVELKQLDRWKVGDRTLAAVRGGIDADAWLRGERLRGAIPPGTLGDESIDDLKLAVQKLMDAVEEFEMGDSGLDPVEIDLTLPSGTRIVGELARSFVTGAQGPASVGFGGFKHKHRLQAWLELMALVAHDPEGDWRTAAIQYDKDKKVHQSVVLRPRSPNPSERHDAAVEVLERAVAIAKQALREPLPMFPTITPGLLDRSLTGWPEAKANDWQSMPWSDGNDPYVMLIHPDLDFVDLCSLASQPQDPFSGVARAEGFARFLWEPYFETVEDLSSVEEAS